MKIFTSKKGDLSLSVNAIVILVIAIIFLGLAIGFTTKLIGSSKDKLLSGVENVDISTPANSDNPIVFDTKLEVKAGSKVPIKISFYNADSNNLVAAKPIIRKCYTDAGVEIVAANQPLSLTVVPSDVNPYKETRYQAMLAATSAATAGDYICVVGVDATTGTSSLNKQMAFKVTG